LGFPLIREELDQDTPLKGWHESIIKQSPNMLLDRTKRHKPVDHIKGLHFNLSDTTYLLQNLWRRAGLLEDPPARRSGSSASRLRGRGRRQADRGGARCRGAPHRIRASQGHTASRSSPLLVASIRSPPAPARPRHE
jgi:hypothetical protein